MIVESNLANLANLSIITPTFNDLERLRATYFSITEQSNFPLEWIVIDGGSDDGTVNWLTSLSAPFNVHWKSERDQGIYDAMNSGIRLAFGEFLLFLNSGDYFEGQVLDNCYTSASLLRCRARDLFGKDKLRIPRPPFLGIPLPHQAIIFPARKSTFYDLKYEMGADWDYFLRHQFGKTLPIAASKGWVRYSRGGISDKRYIRSLVDQAKISYKYFGFIGSTICVAYSLLKLPLKIYREFMGWRV